MRRRLAPTLALALGALAICGGGRALAQDEPPADPQAQARALFEEGVQYSEQGRWGEAMEYFRRSRELADRPSTAFNMAVALLRLGRPSEVLIALDDYLRMAEPDAEGDRYAEAQRMRELALAAIAHVDLTLEPPAALLEVDGAAREGEGASRALSLDPGRHELRISAEGYEPHRREVALLDGERKAIDIRLTPAPPVESEILAPVPAPAAAPPRRRADDRSLFGEPWFWIGAGVALVGAGVAALVLISPDDPAPYGGNAEVVLQGLRIAP